MVGDIDAKANRAAIGPSGMLKGNLSARDVPLSGKVKGAITASEKLILESKSVLQGAVRASRLVVDEGATFNGKCTMSADNAQAVTKTDPTSP